MAPVSLDTVLKTVNIKQADTSMGLIKSFKGTMKLLHSHESLFNFTSLPQKLVLFASHNKC